VFRDGAAITLARHVLPSARSFSPSRVHCRPR
jgi:hypothetical protein